MNLAGVAMARVAFDESARVREIATRLVATLAADPMLRDRLARVCSEAAAHRFRRTARIIGAPAFMLRPRKR